VSDVTARGTLRMARESKHTVFAAWSCKFRYFHPRDA